MFTKSVFDISIQLHEQESDHSFVFLMVGSKIKKMQDGKEFEDTVLKIEVNEWARRARVYYSSGSSVTYKGFRVIYTEKPRI